MKVQAAHLTAGQLNWLVARLEGHDLRAPHCNRAAVDWAQGGPIIERENIILLAANKVVGIEEWSAGTIYYYDWEMMDEQTGPKPLIAAMRAFVAKRLGKVIDIPGVLL